MRLQDTDTQTEAGDAHCPASRLPGETLPAVCRGGSQHALRLHHPHRGFRTGEAPQTRQRSALRRLRWGPRSSPSPGTAVPGLPGREGAESIVGNFTPRPQ